MRKCLTRFKTNLDSIFVILFLFYCVAFIFQLLCFISRHCQLSFDDAVVGFFVLWDNLQCDLTSFVEKLLVNTKLIEIQFNIWNSTTIYELQNEKFWSQKPFELTLRWTIGLQFGRSQFFSRREQSKSKHFSQESKQM